MATELKSIVSETGVVTSSDANGFVHATGGVAETVTGVKTFSNTIFVGDGSANNVMIRSGDIQKMTNTTIKTYGFASDAGTLTVAQNLAPSYSAASGYSIGDQVTREGMLWVCATGISAGGEAWNSAHWVKTSVGATIGNINAVLDAINGEVV